MLTIGCVITASCDEDAGPEAMLELAQALRLVAEEAGLGDSTAKKE